MATTRSAEKRNRQNLKRNVRNRAARSTIKTAIKEAQELAQAGNQKEALVKAKAATKLLDKAVGHGILHKNNAKRRISRLYLSLAAKK